MGRKSTESRRKTPASAVGRKSTTIFCLAGLLQRLNRVNGFNELVSDRAGRQDERPDQLLGMPVESLFEFQYPTAFVIRVVEERMWSGSSSISPYPPVFGFVQDQGHGALIQRVRHRGLPYSRLFGECPPDSRFRRGSTGSGGSCRRHRWTAPTCGRRVGRRATASIILASMFCSRVKS